ncbi:AraC family L-rhamnose operon regulatory protein RhaS [Fontibacillus solani]|uniref:AraC family L-rhamnose operon regulatory protein RhaS n=1 Tax=Fontibacillus solani TaxID=1572857 RepID=A0A7W3XTQ9_9BACL|nr:helix-turn-helix domain-containing protein [Fontibacillus solani]MBA9087875.1 AraC family L-rhamnose operon regulatory protein RhaS [Fontibacillus solani]
MKWTTIGRDFYPGYHHLMQVIDQDEIVQSEPLKTRYRFILIDEEGGALQIGGQCYSVTAPSVIYLSENDALIPMSGAEIKAKSVYFHPQIVNRKYEFPLLFDEEERQELTETDLQDLWFMSSFRDRSSCIPIDPIYARHLSQIMIEIHEQLTEQPDQSYKGTNTVDSWTNDEIKPIVQFLHTHYRQKIKVEDITRTFHTNKTTLNIEFKQAVGHTMMSYLNSIRMQMAASMLRNTTLLISEIMQMVGFQDSAHFIRNFRKYSGYTPSEYRTQFCWMLKKIYRKPTESAVFRQTFFIVLFITSISDFQLFTSISLCSNIFFETTISIKLTKNWGEEHEQTGKASENLDVGCYYCCIASVF